MLWLCQDVRGVVERHRVVGAAYSSSKPLSVSRLRLFEAALPAQFEQTTQMVRAPHGDGRDELAVYVLLSPWYLSSLPSDHSFC